MNEMDLSNRLLLLFRLTDCPHSLQFLCDAFSFEQPGEIAIAILELCEAGYLCAGASGIQLSSKVTSALPEAQMDVENGKTKDKCADAAASFVAESNTKKATTNPIDAESEFPPKIEPLFAETNSKANEVTDSNENASDEAPHPPKSSAQSVIEDIQGSSLCPNQNAFKESHETKRHPLDIRNEDAITTASTSMTQDNSLADAATSAPGAPTSEDVPCVYAYDRISALNLPKKSETKLLDAGITNVRDLVAAIENNETLKNIKPEIIDIARTALCCCATLPSYSLSIGQLNTLIELSGSTEFVFDLFGSPIDVSALCERDGLEIEKPSDERSFDAPVENLQVAPSKTRKLKAAGLKLVSDLEQLGEEALVEKYGFYPQDASVIFNQIERLHEKEARADGKKLNPFAQFDRAFSSDTLKIVRSVQSELERLDYPVVREEAHVFLAPEIEALTQSQVPHIRGTIANCVMRRIDELPETMNALLEAIWRRARAAIASTTANNRSWIPVDVPDTGCWKQAAHLASRNYKGRCELFDDPSSHTLRLQFQVKNLEVWLDELPSNVKKLLVMRLDGAKNKECGEAFGISKENAIKAIRSILQERPFIIEERYLGLFETYDMTPTQFEQQTGQNSRAFQFLREISSAPTVGKLPYSGVADNDTQASEESEPVVSGDTDIVEVGERIAPKKGPLIEHLLKIKATDCKISVSAAYDAYVDLLSRHGLQQSDWVLFSALPQFESYITSKSPVIVSDYGTDFESEMIRYYEADAYDYAPLNKLLSGISQRNIECGIELVFRDDEVRHQCELLDLRTADELYFAVSRYCDEVSGVISESYPLVALGKVDRNAQVKDVIREFGPAPSWDLATEYYRQYKVPKELFEKNFLEPFEQLRKGSLYLVDPDVADETQINFLKEELAKAGQCCSFDLIKNRFEVQFSNQEVNLGDEQLWNRLGWHRSIKLLVRNGVDEHQYFGELIDARKRFSLDDVGFGHDVVTHPDFRSELEKRKRAFTIVEVTDKHFWSTKPFAQLETPITPFDMRDYVNSAIQFMQENVPYTVKSLRDAGFSHKLDAIEQELDVDKQFYEAVLSEGYLNSALKKTKLGDSTIFCRIAGSYSGSLFLEQVLHEHDAFEIEDLAGYIKDHYGIEVGASQLRQLVKRSSEHCYYCESVDMVFASVETFGRKVQEWL